jgi:Terminase large subunit, T4likevirus-type, N-terminal
MLAQIERRIARLEAQRPHAEVIPLFLDRRAPSTWLPRGISSLTPMQATIFADPARFRVAVAGRRGGKTALAVAELTRAARSGLRKVCWYVAPTYRLAKEVLWEALKSAIPRRWIRHKNETNLSLTLKGYRSTIAIRGANNPDALRGVGLDCCVFDEFANIHPMTWPEIIRPALADRQGEAVFLGTPRGFANHFYPLFTDAQHTPGWSAYHYTMAEGGLVPPEEIDAARAALDPRTFAQEFDADFARSVNAVYLMFSRQQTIRADVEDLGGPLWIGIDFNVNPMSAVIANKAGDELHVFDELTLPNSNTQGMADALKVKFPGRQMVAYPDPTGKARKTSAAMGQTDFTILQQAGFRVVAPSAPYDVMDRVNTPSMPS